VAQVGSPRAAYAPRLVEPDIRAAIDEVLADPSELLTVIVVQAPPQCGGTRVVKDGLVPRLRAELGQDLVNIDTEWPRRGSVAYNLDAVHLPQEPPHKDSRLRLIITSCADLAELPAWASGARISRRVFTLGLLSLVEAQNLLESHLGGSVDPAAVRTLTRLSGFLPEVLEWLVAECRMRGGIERIDGSWRLLDDPIRVVFTPNVESRISALPATTFSVLCELALAEPVPTNAMSVDVHEMAQGLLADGVLCSHTGDTVVFAAPGVAEAIRSLSSESDKARIHKASVAEGRLTEPALRWAAHHGEPVALDGVVRLAKEHLDAHDWLPVIAIADIIAEHPECLGQPNGTRNEKELQSRNALLAELHLHAAQAARFLPDPERAHGHLDIAEDQMLATSTPQQASALFKRLRIIRAELLHYHQGELDLALSHLNRMSEESAHAESIAHSVLHQVWGGRSRAAREAIQVKSRELRRCPPRLRRRVAIAETVALIALGRPQQALRKLTHIALQQTLSSPRAAWTNEEQQAAYVIAALSSDGPAAFPTLRKHLVSTADDAYRPDLVTFYLARASWEFAGGNIDEAHRLASIALEVTDLLDPSGVAAALIALVAETAALRGDRARARTMIARFRRVPLRSSAAIQGGTEAHIAAARYLGMESAPNTFVLHTAETFIENGQFGFAAEILYVGVRFQDRAAAKALCRIAQYLDGNLHTMRVGHAQALLEEDPVSLLNLADSLSKAGLLLYAAEAAAATLAASGVPDAIRRRAKACINSIAATQSILGHALLQKYASAVPDGVSLTPREAEINLLISEGLTNREIAARLHLSRRTIEGHISRLYRKTGETRRAPGRRIR